MHDHIPLRVAIHSGRSDIVAAQTIIRPKLFAAKTPVGIAGNCAGRLVGCCLISLWPGKRIPTGTRAKEQNQNCDVAAIPCHIDSSVRNPWPPEEEAHFC